MRLLSMNAKLSTSWDQAGLPVTASIISDSEADMVAIQECPGKEHLAQLADLLGFDFRIAPSQTGFHTGLLWHPRITEVCGGDKYAEHLPGSTWHGFVSSTLTAPGWPGPITFIVAHLTPHDVDAGVGEARFLMTRARREGWPGIIVGDLNHLALAGPEPDWDKIPEHNRASRTILDQNNPGHVVGDRRVGLALTRGGMVDAAAHYVQATGDETAYAHTGVYGLMRVDQVWTTRNLAPAIIGYERLDHRDVTDHHPILVELNLKSLAIIDRVEFH